MVKQYLARRWKRVPDSISMDGSAMTKTLNVPAGAYAALKIIDEYTVTDAGISAGEEYQGTVNYVKIETPEDGEIFYAEKDELAVIALFANDMAPVDGLTVDGLPTTDEVQDVSYVINGPFVFPNGATVTISKAAYTGEFASATAWVENFSVATCGLDKTPKVTKILKRVASSSATVHTMDTGRAALTKMLVTCATDVFKRITIQGSVQGAGVQTYADETFRPLVKGIYSLHAQTNTETTGKYMLTEINAPYSVDRKATVELTSAAAIVVFFENLRPV